LDLTGTTSKAGEDTDIVHPVVRHIDWNESFYFNVYDKDKDICAFMRIGLKPNRLEKNVFCYLMMPDETTIGMKDTASYDGPTLAASGLKFQKTPQTKEWLLDYTGAMKRTVGGTVEKKKVTLSLRFVGRNDVYDYALSKLADRETFSLIAAAEHVEQFGQLNGELMLDGERSSIGGLGERDHAWGVGDWVAPTIWIWLSCQFSEDFAFNLTKLIVDQRVVDAGFVYNEGRNEPIVRAEVVTEYAKGGGPDTLKVWLTNDKGKVYEVLGEVLRTAKLPYSGVLERNVPIMYESLAKFTHGENIGYGIAEYLIRLK
jgi:hypothetical protein